MASGAMAAGVRTAPVVTVDGVASGGGGGTCVCVGARVQRDDLVKGPKQDRVGANYIRSVVMVCSAQDSLRDQTARQLHTGSSGARGLADS